MEIKKIGISRLYNLGNYENITYSIEAELTEEDDVENGYRIIEELIDKKVEEYIYNKKKVEEYINNKKNKGKG